METLILARHAETEWNVRAALNGDPSVEVPLTERGRAQAEALGRAVGEVDLVAYTRFGRTRATAELAWPAASTIELPEFDEIAFGSWEGTAWADGYGDWARTSAPDAVGADDGESRLAAVARYARGYRLLLERPEPRVAVVAHGATVAYALLALQGRPPERVLLNPPPAVATVVDRTRVVEALAVVEAWLEEPVWA